MAGFRWPAFDRFFEFSIVGLLASGYGAVAISGTLDLPTIAVAAAAILFRTLHAAGLIAATLPDWVANILALVYIGFYPIDYHYISHEFLPATVHLVVFLAAVLLLKARTTRDYFFLKLVALVEILAASLLATGLGFAAFLIAFLLCGMLSMAAGVIRRGAASYNATKGLALVPARLASMTVLLLIGVLALAGSFFVVLPRTAYAALRHVMPERFHLPGFSGQIRLGEIGEIQMNRRPVMHVRIYDNTLPAAIQDHLKWRGSALARFDGRRWYNDPESVERIRVEAGMARLVNGQQQLRAGQRIAYDVQQRGLTGDVLFFAGVPEFVRVDSPVVLKSSVGSYRTAAGWRSNRRYSAYSFLELPGTKPAEGPELDTRARELYLALPRMDTRIGEVARRVTAAAPAPAGKAEAIERYLKTTYRYSLELPETEPADPLAEFMFSRKRGHCEYFASAMAVMLRSAGIPSRVATGFQSGVFNPVSGWRLIRTSDAHSWVEAFIDGDGWKTFDPTPSGAPEGEGALARAMMWIDAAEVFWQDWVMAYDLERQITLADRFGRSSRDFGSDWIARLKALRLSTASWSGPWSWKWVTILVAAAAWLVVAVWMGPRLLRWHRARQRVRKLAGGKGEASDATHLYERMLVLLKNQGVEKPAWMTPREFAAKLDEPLAEPVGAFTEKYHALRFGGNQRAAAAMVALLDQLETQSRAASG